MLHKLVKARGAPADKLQNEHSSDDKVKYLLITDRVSFTLKCFIKSQGKLISSTAPSHKQMLIKRKPYHYNYSRVIAGRIQFHSFFQPTQEIKQSCV